MAVVYLATNLVNGKRYVGATICTLARRMCQHKHAPAKRRGRENGMYFYKAIRKYGFDAFSFAVLLECEPEKVFFEEIRLIALLKPEYNMTSGGEHCLGRKMSDYCRQRLLEGVQRPETRKKMSDSQIKLSANNPELHARRSALARARYEANPEIWKTYTRMGMEKIKKKVMCTTDSKIFGSASEAGRHYKIQRQHITEVCRGGRKTVGGLKFVYFIGEETKVA